MDEITKRLTYALHDTYGYHEDEEKNAEEIRRLLENNGVVLIMDGMLNEWYQQGRKDEREFPSDEEDLIRWPGGYDEPSYSSDI